MRNADRRPEAEPPQACMRVRLRFASAASFSSTIVRVLFINPCEINPGNKPSKQPSQSITNTSKYGGCKLAIGVVATPPILLELVARSARCDPRINPERVSATRALAESESALTKSMLLSRFACAIAALRLSGSASADTTRPVGPAHSAATMVARPALVPSSNTRSPGMTA